VNQYETTEARILSALSLMRSEPEFDQERLDEIKEKAHQVRMEKLMADFIERHLKPEFRVPHYANEVEGEEDIVYG